MGRISKIGEGIIGELNIPKVDDLIIAGTGWNDKAVLEGYGFVCERVLTFADLGINVGSGAGHANEIWIGTWHDRRVAISRGRVHLNQQLRTNEPVLRTWMGVMLYLLKPGGRIIIASSVGGLGDRAKMGIVTHTTDIFSADIPSASYLDPDMGEYVMSGDKFWLSGYGDDTHRGAISIAFMLAAQKAGLGCCSEAIHRFVSGPGFGSKIERTLWASWGLDTVGMSQDPEARLIAVEMMTSPKGHLAYRILAVGYVTDDHDLPVNADIQAEAAKHAPQLGNFVSLLIQDASW